MSRIPMCEGGEKRSVLVVHTALRRGTVGNIILVNKTALRHRLQDLALALVTRVHTTVSYVIRKYGLHG